MKVIDLSGVDFPHLTIEVLTYGYIHVYNDDRSFWIRKKCDNQCKIMNIKNMNITFINHSNYRYYKSISFVDCLIHTLSVHGDQDILTLIDTTVITRLEVVGHMEDFVSQNSKIYYLELRNKLDSLRCKKTDIPILKFTEIISLHFDNVDIELMKGQVVQVADFSDNVLIYGQNYFALQRFGKVLENNSSFIGHVENGNNLLVGNVNRSLYKIGEKVLSYFLTEMI